jgi:hypothetical protein
MRSWSLALALALLATPGCLAGAPAAPTDGGALADAACVGVDDDGDGHPAAGRCAGTDCDDANPAVHPGAPEACNGLDDDCDGEVDDGLGGSGCGVGACRREVPFCVDGRPARCEPGQPSAEACNGLDDDCDGEVDEGLVEDRCGVGACAREVSCAEARAGAACVPGAPGIEVCNGLDDDCDGEVDEGHRARVEAGSYAALAAAGTGCDGVGERMGEGCNQAMHRTCVASGCGNSGFGPLENSGDLAILGCVVGTVSAAIPWSELTARHGGCDGSSQRAGPECNAAIHRWCVAAGHATGFGPVETSDDAVRVTCLPPGVARPAGTTYTVLASHHGDCTARVRMGPACNAAIHRFCTAQGHVTGFGPLENSGDAAYVACVSR